MQYDFNLPPGGALNLDVKGRFFKYRSGTGAIRVRASKGGYVDLLPGQGVWSLDYESLTVQDRSGAQNAGVIIAGDFDFHDDRITGSVEVIDGGRSRTKAQISFYSYVNDGTDVGMFSHSQLWNPVGSGKILVVEKIIMTNGATATVQSLRWNTAPLTNLMPAPQNKMLGGVAGVAQCRSDRLVAKTGNILFNGYMGVNVTLPILNSEPIIVPPGFGLMTVASVTNSEVPVTFEFYEDLI